MEDKSISLSGPIIYTEEGIREDFTLEFKDGRICYLGKKLINNKTSETLDFPKNYHLIPGRIDLHIHGAGGADMMDANFAALDQIRKILAREGTTGFLATTVTATPAEIEKALENVAAYQSANNVKNLGSQILGIHLEGPFISKRQPGAHRQELLLDPDIALFNRWQSCAKGLIGLVTLAPELPQAMEFIQHLSDHNIIASIGHSQADFDTAQLAIQLGATHATHLFNAMHPLHHREPGCVGAILLNKKITAELIVDGHHLHPAITKIALNLKGKEGLVLVTDSMRAKCCGETHSFELGGQTVHVKDGAPRLEDGTLAGSVLGIDQAIKNMQVFTQMPLEDLIYLSSINPAKILKIFEQKGSIALGKDADLVVLDENYSVVLTICQGKIVFRK